MLIHLGVNLSFDKAFSISSTSSRNDYRPTILDGSEEERVFEKIKDISMPLNSNL
jgi:hypothetical protein